ncbi:MAG: hypothetical protein SRB2_01824 [Desulfobacteraceae bacterium Eth-SRB2]|nr:MAG: hypothetical protein SRB2_01824 [Desulfobacteraceae bacterium Eth-SRB2]
MHQLRKKNIFTTWKYFLLFIFLLFGFVTSGYAMDVTLQWWPNSEPDLAGYRVFCREEGQFYNYTNPSWQGTNTTCTINNLDKNKAYYFVTRAFDIKNLESGDSNEVYIEATPMYKTGQLEFDMVDAGGDYVTVNLANIYVSPVVVCSVNYNNNTTPVVVRVSNVTSTSFDVRLQNPSDGAVKKDIVSYLVVEEGTWNIDGVKIEAQVYLSTVNDENNSWVGESQSYGQSYTKPVLLGQVMTENDAGWSVFWCQGSNRYSPPSATALTTGKTVCQDTDTSRADETIGFIVFEAGHGMIGGVEFEASVGADTVQGVNDSPPYTYSFDTAFGLAPQVALSGMAGMNGGDGGWAYVHGSTLATTKSLYLSIDEDMIGDSDRWHTREQVGYVVFETGGSLSGE